FLEASVLAIVAAPLVNNPAGGYVDSVLTLATHFFPVVLRFVRTLCVMLPLLSRRDRRLFSERIVRLRTARLRDVLQAAHIDSRFNPVGGSWIARSRAGLSFRALDLYFMANVHFSVIRVAKRLA